MKDALIILPTYSEVQNIDKIIVAIQKDTKIKEIPISFTDRVYGQSKISYKDVTEFIRCCLNLRFPYLPNLRFIPIALLSGFFVSVLLLYINSLGQLTAYNFFLLFFSLFSLFLLVLGLINLYIMLYIWDDPRRIATSSSPRKYSEPFYSFTALIPARNEEHVIADTIKAISRINYPKNKKEIIIIARTDDTKTIAQAEAAIRKLKNENIRVVTFSDYPINKPHALNYGLSFAKNQIVAVFDAEDEPHKSIYDIANTTMLKHNTDVLQSGVQLMNVYSSWFSALNVLEYFFWFKSALQFFAQKGFIPLAGNTVFFKRSWLHRVHGWDELCLTEDADIGLRLSSKGAKIKVIYDARHTTREETPHSIGAFIKQRTRWKQGFLQILLKGDWFKLPTRSQRVLAAYIFAFPLLELLMALYIPFSIVTAINVKLPIPLALLSILPFYLVLLQTIISVMGMFVFLKSYRLKTSFTLPFILLLSLVPYLFVLTISVIRAVARIVLSNNDWEKTTHLNLHRKNLDLSPIYQSVA